MTAQPDYCGSTDHHPTNPTEPDRHLAAMTNTQRSSLARANIHDAPAADTTTCRCSYAHSACTYASTVLRAADSTPHRRRRAPATHSPRTF
jgi:hypothetical protein